MSFPTRSMTVFASLAALVVAAAPLAAAQANRTGETNEFGSIVVPGQLEISGDPLVVEARIRLNSHYEDQKATFFMFAFDTQNSPTIDATFLSLQTADGQDLTVTEVQGKGSEIEKWFVDIGDMPAVGTEIVMKAEINAKSKGFFSVGSMVVPFNYRWDEVSMLDGSQAKLYGFTQLGVNKETTSTGGGEVPRFGEPGNGKLPVPGASALLAVAAVGAAALVAAGRRARR